ncbi:2-(5''-triphosphoribosyl)-3'-dephosphocoenzyme-A synthase [Vibrio aerogenes CECT 7868]|uniref:Probable 2-(5''-triphosphoribosyl)-3'-dephosphocoenzyme-A synthase n=1 Tax=Vibrio aerogenes CECT 7868 TaxID=1216006 RepID=A0A1M5ZPH2_9VIBR|nr:triphosphoribosyl-dephospho-CoA synthase CitG [Vibrio aerogenes]SHI25823.1 2-(5''-triphosphoribosyl)-3'-dephosphocoenzyme-A synthase [Vibrio aerogenes CECT 7868]
MSSVAVNLLTNPAVSGQSVPVDAAGDRYFSLVAELAYHAMFVEVHLTPKPGLVDLLTNGAHNDMDVPLFEASATAIRPYLMRFLDAGLQFSSQAADGLLSVLRPVGLEAEQAMFAATNGVNTHKGMIFGLGLICGAIGWLRGKGLTVNALYISRTIKRCCDCLVMDELKRRCHQSTNKPAAAETHGEFLYREYGLTGARGEAASGYHTIISHSLPAYEQAIADGYSVEQALWQTMLVLMANNEDTNVVSRGGMHGLRFVRTAAQSLLSQGGCASPDLEASLIQLDKIFTEKRLSPGGSADLLAMTWLLSQIDILDRTGTY